METKPRLIDANKILNVLQKYDLGKPMGAGIKRAIMHIKLAQTVDATPTTHGHWIIDHVDRFGFETLRCSVCGTVQSYGRTPYCPNCPAKMDEKEARENG